MIRDKSSFLRAMIAIAATFLFMFGSILLYQFVIYEHFAPNNRYKYKIDQSVLTEEESYTRAYPISPNNDKIIAYYDTQLREYMKYFIDAKDRYEIFKARVQYGLALECIKKQLKQNRIDWLEESNNYRLNARNNHATTPQKVQQSRDNELLLFENEKIFDFDLIEDIEITILYPVGEHDKDICNQEIPLKDVFSEFMNLYLERYDTVNNSREWYAYLESYHPEHFEKIRRKKNEEYKHLRALQNKRRIMRTKKHKKLDKAAVEKQRIRMLERITARNKKQLIEVKEHIASGKNIEERDKRGYTLLHNAVMAKSLKAVELLLEHGADMYARDSDGFYSPFSLATEDIELFKLFLKHGADVNYQYNKSETALTLAAKGCRNFELVKLLLSKGADPDLIDKYGYTTRTGLFRYCKKNQNYEKMRGVLNAY